MNSYVDEDVMWQRLKDLQREAENRRLIRDEKGLGATRTRDMVRHLAARAWLLAGLAMRRPPRCTWTDTPDQGDARSRVLLACREPIPQPWTAALNSAGSSDAPACSACAAAQYPKAASVLDAVRRRSPPRKPRPDGRAPGVELPS